MEEEVFRDSKDPLKRKIYNDRILPYLNRPEYKVIAKLLPTHDIKLSLKLATHNIFKYKNSTFTFLSSMYVISWIFVTS